MTNEVKANLAIALANARIEDAKEGKPGAGANAELEIARLLIHSNLDSPANDRFFALIIDCENFAKRLPSQLAAAIYFRATNS